MGKVILLLVILFSAYWGYKYYKNSQDGKNKSTDKDPLQDTSDDVDALEIYYKRKIDEIENKSVEEIEKLQSSLDEYKKKLNKITNLKNK